MVEVWSASRVSTFQSCPLKYYYNYIAKFKPNKSVNTELADKGTCFHETVETFFTGKSHEETENLLKENIEKYKIDTSKYNEQAALDRFYLFWDYFVVPREKEGYEVQQEVKVSGKLSNEYFIGFLDLCLQNDKDNKIIVVDYKSGKAIHASDYKQQQVLYAYLKGLEHGWTVEETVNNVKLYIFGPFSEQSDNKTEEEKMLASIKEITFTVDDINDIVKTLSTSVSETKLIDWENRNKDELGVYSFACKFCPYLGSNPDGEFAGCKCSRDKGHFQVRGLKFERKLPKLEEIKN